MNSTHPGGNMSHEFTIVPGTLRQELQWSRVMMGMRSLTSLAGTRTRSAVRAAFGRIFLSESSGTEIV